LSNQRQFLSNFHNPELTDSFSGNNEGFLTHDTSSVADFEIVRKRESQGMQMMDDIMKIAASSSVSVSTKNC
jgi:hypothetical protein